MRLCTTFLKVSPASSPASTKSSNLDILCLKPQTTPLIKPTRNRFIDTTTTNLFNKIFQELGYLSLNLRCKDILVLTMKMKPYLVDFWNRNLYHEWYLLILSKSVLLFVTNTIMQYLQFNKSISTTKVFVRSSLGPCYSIQRSSYVILWIQEPATIYEHGRVGVVDFHPAVSLPIASFWYYSFW